MEKDEREDERVGVPRPDEKHRDIRCRRASRRLPDAENREGKRWQKEILPSALPSLRFPAVEKDEREDERVGVPHLLPAFVGGKGRREERKGRAMRLNGCENADKA